MRSLYCIPDAHLLNAATKLLLQSVSHYRNYNVSHMIKIQFFFMRFVFKAVKKLLPYISQHLYGTFGQCYAICRQHAQRQVVPHCACKTSGT